MALRRLLSSAAALVVIGAPTPDGRCLLPEVAHGCHHEPERAAVWPGGAALGERELAGAAGWAARDLRWRARAGTAANIDLEGRYEPCAKRGRAGRAGGRVALVRDFDESGAPKLGRGLALG